MWVFFFFLFSSNRFTVPCVINRIDRILIFLDIIGVLFIESAITCFGNVKSDRIKGKDVSYFELTRGGDYRDNCMQK